MVTSEQYTAGLERQFLEIFNKSTVLKLSERAMLLTRPQSSVFRTEFLCGQMGTLVVHGDGPDLLMRTYRAKSTLESKIRFLAENGYDYIASKVVIGETHTFNLDVFHHDIAEDINYYIENDDAEHAALLHNILDRTECKWTLQQAMWDEYPDCEWPSYGEVPSTNLVMAKMAARRALELLNDVEITGN